MKAGGKQALGARETAPDYFTLGCSFALDVQLLALMNGLSDDELRQFKCRVRDWPEQIERMLNMRSTRPPFASQN